MEKSTSDTRYLGKNRGQKNDDRPRYCRRGQKKKRKRRVVRTHSEREEKSLTTEKEQRQMSLFRDNISKVWYGSFLCIMIYSCPAIEIEKSARFYSIREGQSRTKQNEKSKRLIKKRGGRFQEPSDGNFIPKPENSSTCL